MLCVSVLGLDLLVVQCSSKAVLFLNSAQIELKSKIYKSVDYFTSESPLSKVIKLAFGQESIFEILRQRRNKNFIVYAS